MNEDWNLEACGLIETLIIALAGHCGQALKLPGKFLFTMCLDAVEREKSQILCLRAHMLGCWPICNEFANTLPVGWLCLGKHIEILRMQKL